MKNFNYKRLKLILLFLFLISSVQIVIIPLTKISVQKIILYPLPEGKIDSFILDICEKKIANNASLDSILGYICSRK